LRWHELSEVLNLPQQWKETIAAVFKKGDNTDSFSNQRILLLPDTYKILSKILLSSLSSYLDEITEHHQC
jgi:hypothetical protein